jgi:hypothetical protein
VAQVVHAQAAGEVVVLTGAGVHGEAQVRSPEAVHAQQVAGGRGEDQVVRPFAVELGFEQRHQRRGDAHGALPGGLGGADLELAADVGHGFAHVQPGA